MTQTFTDSHRCHSLPQVSHPRHSHTLSHVHSKITHTLGSCTVSCYRYTHLESTHPDPEITHPDLHTFTNHAPEFMHTWRHTHTSHTRIGSHLAIMIKTPHTWISVTLRCLTFSSCTRIGTNTHSHYRIDLEATDPTSPHITPADYSGWFLSHAHWRILHAPLETATC